MKILTKKFFVCFSLLVLTTGCQTTTSMNYKAGFSFGPASSQITTATASIWLRTKNEENLQVAYSKSRNFSRSKFTKIIRSTSQTDFTSIHNLKRLLPDTEYFYRGVIRSKNIAYGDIGRFRTPSEKLLSFRFAVSGDTRAKYQPFDLFNKIGQKKPDFFIYLGDTIYADYPSKEFFADLSHYRWKYRENRDDKPLQEFLKKIPVYAVWDDHEVENNFNSSWGPQIATARRAFREYWPVKSKEKKILYYSFSWSPLADFFILDTRQFRSAKTDENGEAPDATMLGKKQKKWFKKAISKSKAPFKFIISSVPFNTYKNVDKWSGYVTERDEIKNHITRNNIRGIVTISADIHRAIAFSNSSGEPREYIVGPIAANIKCSKKNFYESLGYFFMCDSYNYLTIDVTVEHGKPTAEIKYFDDKNKLRYREKFKSNKRN
ncbi:MAG: alkaline phosphatase D family protein [Nitrospinota bacterium]|nr:alkaline phosphatase D family protein [Nitrospinota bacterium]